MKTYFIVETVFKSCCLCCGASGPMAMTDSNAEFLAVRCGWQFEDSLCPHCAEIQNEKKSVKAKVSVTKSVP